MNLTELKRKKMAELIHMGTELNIEGAAACDAGPHLRAPAGTRGQTAARSTATASSRCLPDGFGFLRAPDYNYLPGPDDIYVSPSQIRRFDLRTGDTVERARSARPRSASATSRCSRSRRSTASRPRRARDKILFDNLTPLYPNKRLNLEHDPKNYSTRIIDLLVPDRQGAALPHRRRRRAPARRCSCRTSPTPSPPTTPRSILIVLLIDERPEEVTDMQRTVKGEVVASTFDEPRHAPRAGRRDGDREGQAPGRAQAGRGHPARLDHPPGARLQHGRARRRARSSPAASTPTRCTSRSASSARRATSRRAARSPSSPPRSSTPARAWTR